MNIEKLIEAAKKIDKLAELREASTKEWAKLAAEARSGLDRNEVNKRKMKLDSAVNVIDFGDAIAELRRALRTRPRKK
jgi:hypothetical protein